MSTNTENFEKLVKKEYEHGFVTDIDADTIPPGLSEEIITFIFAIFWIISKLT